MSGTLAPNGNPLEIYPHMRALFPKTLLQDDKVMGESAFAQMYTHGEPTMNGWKVHSTKNVSNLMKRLQPVLLNVPQSEVDKELPAFSMEVVPLDEALSNELALAQQDKRVWALADHIQAYGQLPAPHALEDAHISTLLRLIGMAKIAPVLEMAREFLLQTNKKLVLYVKHIDVLRGLHNNLTDYKPAAVHGAVPAALRERELERFRSDKECRVFIAQMDTAGTGFDLVEASDAWFAEITWNPSTILQAAKRLHRPGQRRPVAVRLFSLQGTLDTAVERVIARKTGQIREAFQD
jgi:SNF2 family DNA or RNA helicase